MFKPTEFAFWTMILGGLGLFLFGISSISSTLKKMASKKLSEVINKVSDKPFKGLLLGTGFTALIQSSSGTSALTIGLVRAGAMSFVQAAAIIIGANIGTTITSFIVSIPFMEFFPLILFLGSIILLFATRKKGRNIGDLFFAFGAIFFGLWLMEINLSSLAKEQWFISLFSSLGNSPWLGLLLGTVATMCLQSSSAVIGVIQGLYAVSAGTAITLFGVLPIVFGANIGTTITAVFSSIGGSKESKKVAIFHVLYNVVGALLFMGIIFIFKKYLNNVSYFAKLDSEGKVISWYLSPKMQLALSHLIFNLVTAILFFLFLKPITKFINFVFPDNENKKKNIHISPLDYSIMKTFPSEGLLLAKNQVLNMFSYSKLMFETIKDYLLNFKKEDEDFIHSIEASIDHIDRQLNEYLSSFDKSNLTNDEISLLLSILKACKDIERIGDYGENLVSFYAESHERKEKISDFNINLFNEMNNNAIDIISNTIETFATNNHDLGIKVIQHRRDLVSHYDEIINEHFALEIKGDGSNKNKNEYIDLVLVDIINSYQRVYSHCSNIAKIYGTDKQYIYTKEEEDRFLSLKDRY